MMKGPRENEKTETQKDIDDFLYELPEKKMPELELGDGLLNSLGTSTSAKLFFMILYQLKKEKKKKFLNIFLMNIISKI